MSVSFPVSESLFRSCTSMARSSSWHYKDLSGCSAPCTNRRGPTRHTPVRPSEATVGTDRSRVHAFQAAPQHPRQPIISGLLSLLRGVWLSSPASFNHVMLWAAASSCFFGFFSCGFLLMPPSVHLAWEDMAVDSATVPTKVRFHLRWSKTAQFGQGVDVFVTVISVGSGSICQGKG